MDPTAFSNANHLGEMRELLTGTGRTGQPTVISSLRQLQSVTEAGVARRRRRRTHFRSQRDALNVFGNARNSDDSIVGWDTSGSSWDISSATNKDHRVLLPSAVLRKMEKPDAAETDDVLVKDRANEVSRSFRTLSEDNIMEENSETPIQSAARRRRIDSGLMETSTEKERENGGGKAFSLVDAPTRAPSQKSIPGRDALPNTNCFLDSWQSASRTNGHVSQNEEELVEEMTQDDQKRVMCKGEDTRDGTTNLATKSLYPPAAGGEGPGTRRGAFCGSTSHGGARSPESTETDERVAQVPRQTMVKNALSGRESKWSGNDGAEAIYRRLLRIEGNYTQHNMASLGQLMEKVSHSVRDEDRGEATSNLFQTGKDVISEALSTASSDQPDNAKLRQLQLFHSIRRGKDIQKGESGGGDQVLSAEACYEPEQSKVALIRLEGQSQRDNDTATSNWGAVDCGSPHVLPLHGKQSTEKLFLHLLSRERILSTPATKPQLTERCSKNDWFREEDTCTRAALIHAEDASCTRARGTNTEEEGAEHVSERVEKDVEADSENKTSTAHSDVGTGQEKCVVKVSCEGEERPKECIITTNSTLPLSSSNGKKYSGSALFAMDTSKLHSAGEGSLGLLSNHFGQADQEAPASVSLYYHVQEASPRPHKRLPMHNAAETTQQPNRLYPVVKGVSRDNAKRRWAVYWKGSRRYFYDKLNENCYHAYQQAVNFRKYSYIQHASRGKNFSVTKVASGYRKDKSPLKQFDAASSAKAGPTFNYPTERVSLNDTMHPSSQLPCESEETSIQDSPQNLSSPMRDAVALVPDSQNQASESDALITGQAKSSSSSVVRTYQFDRKTNVEPADDDAAGGGSPLNQLSREGLPADSVMNMYKTALLMVLQDLKASLTGLSASPAPPSFSQTESSSNDFQECGNDLQSTSCSTPSCHLKSNSSNGQSSSSAQSTDPQNADPDLRLRPFLLLVVDWHLETVKLASQRRELQPLLAVFSPCFQHLLLPRDAPRPLQQKIYRELMELHTTQALSHLANA